LSGSIAVIRDSISLADLLVNVTANKPDGLIWPVDNSHAILVVKTLVLPLPAPAKIKACSAGNSTAAACWGFNLALNAWDIINSINNNEHYKYKQGDKAPCY
jgi:hypothetical protein